MNNGLTIAIPVYNEERFIERAIRRTAPQCEQLIVSDNASTDGTSVICQRLQQEFPNLCYVRQQENIGSIGNCASILDITETPFIMYMGSHDLIDENYVSTVLPAIVNDSTIAVATGELCLDYETRIERVDSYKNWTVGLDPDPKTRILSFLFSRAPLEWASYGIFRTTTVRTHFTCDLPVYGVDIIFLAGVLGEGRFMIRKGTCYHARVREDSAPKSDYLERVTARGHTKKAGRKLKNDFRAAQYKVMLGLYPGAGSWNKLVLRYRAMVRFGTFRVPGVDPLFHILYIPVKLARKFYRLKFTHNNTVVV